MTEIINNRLILVNYLFTSVLAKFKDIKVEKK